MSHSELWSLVFVGILIVLGGTLLCQFTRAIFMRSRSKRLRNRKRHTGKGPHTEELLPTFVAKPADPFGKNPIRLPPQAATQSHPPSIIAFPAPAKIKAPSLPPATDVSHTPLYFRGKNYSFPSLQCDRRARSFDPPSRPPPSRPPSAQLPPVPPPSNGSAFSLESSLESVALVADSHSHWFSSSSAQSSMSSERDSVLSVYSQQSTTEDRPAPRIRTLRHTGPLGWRDGIYLAAE
ncbi:hypothetical protein C8R43DRAFT_1132087 [Mycena crocata]|nr:hypothetical protein C8R43DRAFT_1132087 [Mycena crocata]